MIYVGRRYTARVAGTIVKDVCCEKCGDRYLYRMRREASGEGSSPYYMDNDGAARRAENRAVEKLNKKLKNEHEAVPCPKCGFLQAAMVRDIRRRRLSWVNILGIILAIGGALVAVIINGTNRYQEDVLPELFGSIAVAVIGVGLCVLRLVLNRKFDPNTVPNAGGWHSACEAVRYEDVIAAERQQQQPAPMAAIPVTTASVSQFPGDWYFTANGAQHGPITGQELQSMADQGSLDPTALIWNEALTSWVPAGSVDGLFAGAVRA